MEFWLIFKEFEVGNVYEAKRDKAASSALTSDSIEQNVYVTSFNWIGFLILKMQLTDSNY